MPTTLTVATKASLFLPVRSLRQPPTAPPHSVSTIFARLRDMVLAPLASWFVPFAGASSERGA